MGTLLWEVSPKAMGDARSGPGLLGSEGLLGPVGSLGRRLAEALGLRVGKTKVTVLSALVELCHWRNRFHGHGALEEPGRALAEGRGQLGHLELALGGLSEVREELCLETGESAEHVDPPTPVEGEPRWSEQALRPWLGRVDRQFAGVAHPAELSFLEAIDRRWARVWFRDAFRLEKGHVPRGALSWPQLMQLETLAGDLDPERRGRGPGAP